MIERPIALLAALLILLAIVLGALFFLGRDRGEAPGRSRAAAPFAIEPASDGARAALPLETTAPEPSVAGAAGAGSTVPVLDGAPRSPDRSVALSAYEQELREGRWIAGRVIFPEGTPLDERVRVVARGKDFANGPDHGVDVALDGRFELAFSKKTKKGRLELEARYLFLEEQPRIEFEAGLGEIVLEPKLGGAIALTFEAPEGREDLAAKLAGKSVSMNGYLEMGRSWESRSQRTADLGAELAVEIGGLDASFDYRLWFDPGFLPSVGKDGLAIEPGEVLTIREPLALGVDLAGVVEDEAGAGVPGVQINVKVQVGTNTNYGMRNSHSKPDGSFEVLGIQAGRITLLAEKTGFLDAELELGELDAGTRKEAIALRLSRGRSIAGRASWPDGSPAGGCYVFAARETQGEDAQLFDGFQNDAAIETAEDGTFLASGLEEGAYTIEVRAYKRKGEVPGEGPTDEAEASESRGARKRAPKISYRARAVHVVEGTSDLALTLTAGYTVSGKVVDDAGTPLTSFQLRASRADEEERSGPFDSSGLARSGLARMVRSEDGSFELEGFQEGSWMLEADASDHSPSKRVLLEIPAETGPVTLIAGRMARVVGSVVDASGRPVADARVLHVHIDEDGDTNLSMGSESKAPTTDAEGRFTIESVDVGTTKFTAKASGYAPSDPVLHRVEPALEVEIELVLLRGGTIEGRALDPRGGVAAWREVSVYSRSGSSWRNCTTDEAGRFRVEHLLPGEYVVQLQISAADQALHTDAEGETDWQALRHLHVSTSARVVDGEVTEVTLGGANPSEVLVTGRVRIAGEPAANAHVTAFQSGSSFREPSQTQSAQDGSFELRAPSPGTYTFRIWWKGTQFSATRAIPEDVTSVSVELEFLVGGLAGRVVDREGTAIAGERVIAHPFQALSNEWADLNGTASITTGPDGSFEFVRLVPGTYTVEVGELSGPDNEENEEPTYGHAARSGIVVEEGGRTEGIELVVGAPASLAGVVRGSDGLAARRVFVYAWDEHGIPVSRYGRQADEHGAFVLRGLGAGELRVAALGDYDVSSLATSVHLSAGQTSEVELTLEPGCVLNLRALDSSGDPAEASFAVTSEDGLTCGHLVQNRFWRSGRYVAPSGTTPVGPLPPGRYDIVATFAGGARAEERVRVAGEAQLTVELEAKR